MRCTIRSGILIVSALTLFISLLACGSSGPVAGTALADSGTQAGLTPGWLVGQRYIDVDGALGNGSSEPITLVSIKPDFAYGADVVDVYRTALFVPTSIPGDPGLTVGGIFLRWPPAERLHKECTYFRLRPVKGHVVNPHDDAPIALFIHMRKPGKFKIKGEWITYRQHGKLYRQLNTYAIATYVRATGKPYDPGLGEEKCRGRPLSQALHAPLAETGHPGTR